MKLNFDDTICAPATIPGTGAISVIRVSGTRAHEIADKVIRCRQGSIGQAKGYSIKFGEVFLDGQLLDEVLVSVFRAPHSYTGEDGVEISCHASSYICSEIMSLLCQAGARAALPGEFSQRAFVNGKMDLAQTEAVADVIAASSQAAHKVAMTQLKGAYSGKLRALRDQLVEIAALMELELDFSEEDVEFADRSHLKELLSETMEHIDSLARSFRLGNALKSGIPVAIVGEVNAGKSTLLNALLGHDRAIVSDVPGTTRDTVEETFNVDGVLLRFIDTAGLRETDDVVENIGIERSRKALSEAEIVLAVVDASSESAVQSCHSLLELCNEGQKVIVVFNKSDIAGDEVIAELGADLNGGAVADCRSEAGDEVIAELGADLNGGAVADCRSEAGADCGAGAFVVRGAGMCFSSCMVSAANNDIASLLAVLSPIASGLISGRDDQIMVTNLRHYDALRSAQSHLQDVQRALSLCVPTDLVAEDLRASIADLNQIFGEQIDNEGVLGEIFSRFCIGK